MKINTLTRTVNSYVCESCGASFSGGDTCRLHEVACFDYAKRTAERKQHDLETALEQAGLDVPMIVLLKSGYEQHVRNRARYLLEEIGLYIEDFDGVPILDKMIEACKSKIYGGES